MADRRDEQALLGLARDDRRARVAAREHRGARVEPQARLLLLGPVALDAVLDQDRPDLRLEEPDLLRARRNRFPTRRAGSIRRRHGDEQAHQDQARSVVPNHSCHRGHGWRSGGLAGSLWRAVFNNLLSCHRAARPSRRAARRDDARSESRSGWLGSLLWTPRARFAERSIFRRWLLVGGGLRAGFSDLLEPGLGEPLGGDEAVAKDDELLVRRDPVPGRITESGEFGAGEAVVGHAFQILGIDFMDVIPEFGRPEVFEPLLGVQVTGQPVVGVRQKKRDA